MSEKATEQPDGAADEKKAGLVKELFDSLKQTVHETTQPMYIARSIGHELDSQIAHGAHELAAALFSGSAFVMYQRGSHDHPSDQTPDHGLGVHGPSEAKKPDGPAQPDNGHDVHGPQGPETPDQGGSHAERQQSRGR